MQCFQILKQSISQTDRFPGNFQQSGNCRFVKPTRENPSNPVEIHPHNQLILKTHGKIPNFENFIVEFPVKYYIIPSTNNNPLP